MGVGGGWRVTATLAAQLDREDGLVHVYEGKSRLSPELMIRLVEIVSGTGL